MIKNFIDTLATKKTSSDDDGSRSRRMYERRACDMCVSKIAEQAYPVENWSQGGVLLSGDTRQLGVDQVYDLTLRFKLRDRVMDVKHPARVIRKVGARAAMQFLPTTQDVRNAFQQVIDDWIAGDFANSQA